MNYAGIIKRAFHVTKSHPLLWLFGLIFTFNINIALLTFVNIFPFTVDSPLFQILTGYRNLGTLTLFALFLFWLVLNWGRIIFILYSSDILNIERRRLAPRPERPSFKLLVRESRSYFLSISLVSFLNFLACLAAYFVVNRYLETLTRSDLTFLKFVVPTLSFVLLAFLFNMVDVFASFFIVLYRSKVFIALNLTLDMLLKKWKAILKGMVVFVLLYGMYIILASVLANTFVLILDMLFPALINLQIIHIGITDSLLIGFSSVVFWFCASLFNIFFKTSFLLFFSEVVKPPIDSVVKEEQAELSALPAGSN